MFLLHDFLDLSKNLRVIGSEIAVSVEVFFDEVESQRVIRN